MWKQFKKVGFGAVAGLALVIVGCPFYGWKFWFAILTLHAAWAYFPHYRNA